MTPLATVLLRHETSDGDHYDWMIENPAPAPGSAPGSAGTQEPADSAMDPASLLTWRVDAASWQWTTRQTLDLWQLPHHRRAYLTYEGEISGGRGRVHRVDRGSALLRVWLPDAAVIDLTMTHFTGTLRMERIDPQRWTAVVIPAAAG